MLEWIKNKFHIEEKEPVEIPVEISSKPGTTNLKPREILSIDKRYQD